jgi:hypothetical protein
VSLQFGCDPQRAFAVEKSAVYGAESASSLDEMSLAEVMTNTRLDGSGWDHVW